jgi:hypothetical protein
MKHISKLTVAKASFIDKQTDEAGAVFFQIWLFVFTWILAGAFGKEDTYYKR